MSWKHIAIVAACLVSAAIGYGYGTGVSDSAAAQMVNVNGP